MILTSLLLTQEQTEKIGTISKDTDISKSEIIRHAIDNYLKDRMITKADEAKCSAAEGTKSEESRSDKAGTELL